MPKNKQVVCCCGSGKFYKKCCGILDRFPDPNTVPYLHWLFERERAIYLETPEAYHSQRGTALFGPHSVLWKINDYGGLKGTYAGRVSKAALKNLEDSSIPAKRSFEREHLLTRMSATRLLLGISPSGDVLPYPTLQEFRSILDRASRVNLLTDDENEQTKRMQEGITAELSDEEYSRVGIEWVPLSLEQLQQFLKAKDQFATAKKKANRTQPPAQTDPITPESEESQHSLMP